MRDVKTDIEMLVKNAELNTTYELPRCFTYAAFEVTKEKDGTYCWSLTPRHQSWKSVFPMSSSQIVKVFKTVGGAKRSLLKRIYR